MPLHLIGPTRPIPMYSKTIDALASFPFPEGLRNFVTLGNMWLGTLWLGTYTLYYIKNTLDKVNKKGRQWKYLWQWIFPLQLYKQDHLSPPCKLQVRSHNYLYVPILSGWIACLQNDGISFSLQSCLQLSHRNFLKIIQTISSYKLGDPSAPLCIQPHHWQWREFYLYYVTS